MLHHAKIQSVVRRLLLAVGFLIPNFAVADEVAKRPEVDLKPLPEPKVEGVKLDLWRQLHDPRNQEKFEHEKRFMGILIVARKGEETSIEFREVARSILIVSWGKLQPYPGPERRPLEDRYQICGIPGFHSRSHVEKFLTAFYELDHSGSGSSRVSSAVSAPYNIIVAGNCWNQGLELGDKIGRLKLKKPFKAYYNGGRSFREAILEEEPADRLRLIRKAHELATERPDEPKPEKIDQEKSADNNADNPFDFGEDDEVEEVPSTDPDNPFSGLE